jgi:hypothetical protein
VATVLCDEFNEIFDSAGTVVCNWGVLLSGGVEFDGWETLDLIWNIVGSGVNLGDGNLVRVALEEFSELIVLRCKASNKLANYLY